MKLLFILFPILLIFSCNQNLMTNISGEDTTKPKITITSLENGFILEKKGLIPIQGKATDDFNIKKAQIEIDSGDFVDTHQSKTSDKSLDWIYYLDTSVMSLGNHTITAKATDLWGNTETTSITITINDIKPTATLSGTPPPMTDKTEIDITVGGDDIVSYKYKIDNGPGSWIGETDGIPVSTHITKTGLSAGTHIVYVIGKNSQGTWQTGITYHVWSINTKKIFTASDGVSYDHFGLEVAVSGNGTTIVAGAPYDADKGINSGSIYVYKWNGVSWDETKITASDGATNDYFGRKISISQDGNTVVVGVSHDDDKGTDSGSAYIYKFESNIWIETKIFASDGSSGDIFGKSISISSDGNTVIVGNGFDYAIGAVYIYKWENNIWIETTKLTASDGAANDNFGHKISISYDGTTIVVGAYGDVNNGDSSGSVYIYKWNGVTWDETKITASDGANDDFFGWSVSISPDGTTIIVGAYGDDDNGDSSGSAYIYKWNGVTWDETKITASDGVAYDYFGVRVSISSDGNKTMVGAIYDDDKGTDSGSAYIYEWNGISWDKTKILASDGAAEDWFGNVSLSYDGNSRVVGAYGKNSSRGAFYLFYE